MRRKVSARNGDPNAHTNGSRHELGNDEVKSPQWPAANPHTKYLWPKTHLSARCLRRRRTAFADHTPVRISSIHVRTCGGTPAGLGPSSLHVHSCSSCSRSNSNSSSCCLCQDLSYGIARSYVTPLDIMQKRKIVARHCTRSSLP